MRRKFANLGTEASIKNTLPPVNEDNENKQAFVPYKSRSGSIELNPQEEYEFEVSSSGKAIYYMKQERENLKTVGLYEDKDSPIPPVEKQYIYEKGEDSDVEFYLHLDGNLVQPGTNLTIGNEYIVLTFLDQGDIFINDVLKAENKDKLIFTLTEDMSVNNKVIITVKRNKQPPTNPIYIKDEESDIEFVLGYFDSVIHMVRRVNPGDSMNIGTTYTVGSLITSIIEPLTEDCDIYINGTVVAESVRSYQFTLTEEIVDDNNEVVITVKNHTDNTVKLTYAMGSYADGGSVPDPVTVQRGTTVYSAAYPTPTRTGYGWAGWATTDGASVSEYQMMTPITVNDDMTLYPVFIEQQLPPPQLPEKGEMSIDNTDGEVDINVVLHESKYDTDVKTISAGSRDYFSFASLGPGAELYIQFANAPQSASVSFDGTYNGNSYTEEALSTSGQDIYAPNGGGNTWTFAISDSGTLTVESTAANE